MLKKTKNNRAVRSKEIPETPIGVFRGEVIKECRAGRRLICLFAEHTPLKMYAVLADDATSELYIGSAPLTGASSYESITKELPCAQMFERELWEETGIVPQGHPWLKPVRYAEDRHDKDLVMENYPFFKMRGSEVHEVAVGPVHAGIIEPGHFRFMCTGEDVHHLEIQLGYQHRGVKKLFAKNNGLPAPQLAEAIAGDTAVGHAVSYCGALEALSGCEPPKRAHAIRAAALELERMAMHLGSLAGLSGDIAYLTGNAVYGANRTVIINTMLKICGSRYGKGLVRPGGVVFDIDGGTAKQVKENIEKAYKNMKNMSEEMFSTASVLSRFQLTGVVSKQDALEAGLTGFAARASGVAIDARVDHPYGIYNYLPIRKMTMNTGDVFARAYLRYIEASQSADFICELMDSLPHGGIMERAGKYEPDSFVISITEAWRGPVTHIMTTDRAGKINAHRIYDPSFNNWFGLALAVRGNGISDFPICNKSFDLSYCGNDL